MPRKHFRQSLADAGEMNLHLNHAREHMVMAGEAEPVGIILCSDKNDAVVKDATAGINAWVFASRYLANLPGEEELRQEIVRTKRVLELRGGGPTWLNGVCSFRMKALGKRSGPQDECSAWEWMKICANGVAV